MLKNVKMQYVMLFIFLLIIACRFIFIDKIPTGMQYDEVEYSLSSKTFQLMGTDLSGVGFPQSLVSTRTLGRISPVPIMILSPFWFIFNLNMTSFRSLYVILNIITALSFISLLQVLFNNKKLALLGGILFLLNPWSFFLSRHGMDGSFALLFYILGTTFLLKKYSNRNIILAFIFYFLGCFSYHGAKLSLVPLAIIVSCYKGYTENLTKKQLVPYILIICALIVTVGGFIVGGLFAPDSILKARSHEFVFTNSDTFSHLVDSFRNDSINSQLDKIFINKFVYAARYFADNYIQAFSAPFLFYSSELLEFHGFFYIFEFAFLLLGFAALYAKKPTIFWLLTAITLIAPLSTATSLGGFSIINRGILLLPMLLIFITYGLYTFYMYVTKFIPKFISIFFIGTLYLFSFIYFQFIYFSILPIQIFMHYQTPTRVLTKLLLLESPLSPNIVIVASKPQVLFSGLLFYLPPKEQEKILQEKQTFGNNTEFKINNILITNHCVTKFDPKNMYIIDHDKQDCLQGSKETQYIINQKDAGVIYHMQGGKACSSYALSRWISPHLISDFDIEQMSTKEFCTRWIAK